MNELGIKVRLKQTHSIKLDITLNCQNNEVLALIGPSGSGKSTVLRAIAGLYSSQYGYIECQQQRWLDTANAINMPTYQRAVGLVFQNYALFPHFSAQENVAVALGHLPKKQRLKTAQSLLKKVHLKGLEKRYPMQLSGGQQQRVAVARALARDPKVLLLDEPFSAVDQVTRRRLYRELIELRNTLAMPIILVTHDLDEANLLADRVCLLHHGVSLQSGTPMAVATSPVNAQVAKLMDQQNIFTAEVIAHNPQTKISLLSWHGEIVEVSYQPDYVIGEKICWMIPATDVILHRRYQVSKGDRENPFSGIIIDYMLLGGYVTVLIELSKQHNMNVTMSIPLHVARRNGLKKRNYD
ncbi:MAG: ABC transporter ATP-binding protein [Methylococcales bacterium]|nr:ABC transporter ATP-binding protein [Methylococcales bacterium]